MSYQPRIFAEQTLADRAREYEKASMWRKAAETWALTGQKDNEQACYLLAESGEYGDAIRAHVLREAGEEPDVPNEYKQDSITWMTWFRKMDAASKYMQKPEIFKQYCPKTWEMFGSIRAKA